MPSIHEQLIAERKRREAGRHDFYEEIGQMVEDTIKGAKKELDSDETILLKAAALMDEVIRVIPYAVVLKDAKNVIDENLKRLERESWEY